MAYTYGTLSAFSGVRTDLSQALMSTDMSPDACNMDTRSGDLKTATGFSSVTREALPTEDRLLRLYLYPVELGMRMLAVTSHALYSYIGARREWRAVYTFNTWLTPARIDFTPVRLGSEDRLLIAYGDGQALLYDAVTHEVTPFGSAEKLSDVPISYAALHFGRLFASGNMLEPSRLYWSKAPGDDRAIDDWRADPASENVSGGFVDVGIGDDPITGLFPMSNQLLIFTRDNLYRLLGDRPSNFRVVKVDTAVQPPQHTACVRYADRLYFLTADGLFCYDGQTVRRPASASAPAALLQTANLQDIASAACGDRLYFLFRSENGEALDTMLEYDVLRDRFMVRRGFLLRDLSVASGWLCALSDAGRVVRFDGSPDYDGDPIEAWWDTPLLDFGHKEADKTLLSMTATGAGTLAVTVESNGARYETQAVLDEHPLSVTEIPLCMVGRVFRLRFSNVNGQPLRLDAKPTLLLDLQRRPV